MYFYIEKPKTEQLVYQTTGFTFDHIKSHRLQEGEQFLATDMAGQVYACVLSFIDKRKTVAGYKIIKNETKATDLNHVLVQGIPDRNYLDKLIEVATLAGFKKIILFESGFSQKYTVNQESLLTIALQAALLAEFTQIPEIEVVDAKILKQNSKILENSLVLSQFGELQSSVKLEGEKYIWAGPEGGWNKSEDQFFADSNLPLLSLAPNCVYPAWLAGSVWRFGV